MSEHPIEGLMITAMNSIQNMVDVNTIIGEPIETSNNMIIIPISKVAFGFAAGGSEFKGETLDEYKRKDKEEDIQYRLPFGGGSGAGVSINPIAFLVVSNDMVRLLPVNYSSAVDKLIEYVPDLMEKANSFLNKTFDKKCAEKEQVTTVEKKSEEKVKEGKKKIKIRPDEELEIEYDETQDDNKNEGYIEEDE